MVYRCQNELPINFHYLRRDVKYCICLLVRVLRQEDPASCFPITIFVLEGSIAVSAT